MALFDLFGRTWAMCLAIAIGPYTFRELQERCGTISPSILNSRIKDLKEADILERTLDGYKLTE